MQNQGDIGRRIRAARVLAGLPSPLALSQRIDRPGLGPKTLTNIERGARPVREEELRQIAEACGLPVEFFTVDFAVLPLIDSLDEVGTLEELVTAVVERALPAMEDRVVERAVRRLRDEPS